MAGEVALEDPGRVSCALALGDAAGDVGAGRSIVLAAVQDDGVQRSVELAVAAAAEPMADRLAAGGGQGCDARESGEGSLGADATAM